MNTLFNLNSLFKDLLQDSSLVDLLKIENMTEDDNSIEFKNNNGHLRVENLDNGFSMSYKYSSEPIERVTVSNEFKESFHKFCDTLSDDLFQESCDLYTEVYGTLKDLEDDMTPEKVNNFKTCVKRTAEEAIDEAESIIAEMKEVLSNLD